MQTPWGGAHSICLWDHPHKKIPARTGHQAVWGTQTPNPLGTNPITNTLLFWQNTHQLHPPKPYPINCHTSGAPSKAATYRNLSYLTEIPKHFKHDQKQAVYLFLANIATLRVSSYPVEWTDCRYKWEGSSRIPHLTPPALPTPSWEAP